MINRALIITIMLVFFVFAWLSPRPGSQLEEGFAALFDGRSLQGWYMIGGDSSFSVEDGEIVGRHGAGENTFLRTEQSYGDFVLKLDMRWDELGNSGVLFRAQQRDGDGRAYGYQYELDHSERAWSGGIYDEARRGWLQSLEDNTTASDAIKLDDWNEVVIEARGPSLKTWVNGIEAANIVDSFDAEGFIALQVHSGDVGVMRWRNIRLKELEPIGVPGEPLDGRRQLRDFSVDFSLSVCAQTTSIKLRQARAVGGDYQYIEVLLSENTAQAAIQQAGSRRELDVVNIETADAHRVRIVAQGQRVTLSVDELDIARLDDANLPDRGKLLIESAPCAEPFDVASLNWTDLKPRNQQPQFYQTLDTEPAPVLTATQALQSFRVAPGFAVELVAAEPLVGDPVAMAWDEYGRLYVAEMRSYMPDAYGSGRGSPHGRVVRLEDTNNDGQMDHSEVFLDGLTYPRAVAVTNDGILIAEPPTLWLCELPGRDAVCSNKRSLGEYGVAEGDSNVEHLENKLLAGLDNWYYNSKSARKLRIVNGELENKQSFYRGQWGIGKDNLGRLYYNHNSNLITADFFAAEDLFDQPTYTPVAGIGEVLTAPEEVFSVRVNPGVNRAYLDGTLRPDGRLHNATSASGLTPYRGNQLPDRYAGHVFVAEPAANVIAQFAIVEEGVRLSAEHQLYDDPDWGQREFLGSTDERFRPVDVLNGPDGALYIIDMYRGLIQDEHYLTEELREQVLQRQLDAPIGLGRIWRLRHSEGADTTAVTSLGDASVEELVAALQDDNGWVRDTAQRLLLKSAGQQTAALQALAVGENSLAAIHALWTLQGRQELDSATVKAVLNIGDSARQIQVLRAGRDQLVKADLLAMAGLSDSLQPALRMQLMFVLGDYLDSAEVQVALLELLAANLDNDYLRQAAIRAMRAREIKMLPALLSHPMMVAESSSASQLLQQLTVSAYRTARPDFTSDEPAAAALGQLLLILESQRDQRQWAQLAMLDGLFSTTRTTGFKPAAFTVAPTIFTDSSIDDTSPLWDARLKGRRAFTWPGDELAMGITPLSPGQLALMEKGAALYPSCAACHGPDGAGIAGLGPVLAQSAWVNGAPEWLGRIILQGFDTDRNGVMPPHAHLPALDNDTLAGLMLYLRRSWGNTADPVALEMVASIRDSSAARSTPWSVEELQAVEVDRGYDKFVGEYQVSFLTMTITEELDGLHISVPMYGGGLLNEESEGVFSVALGDQTIKIEFQINEDGSVPAFDLYREGEKIPVKRK